MIYRAPRPDGNFYVLNKAISEDDRLSWAARGLLIFLLGKPDHWQVSPAALVNATKGSVKPTGRDGVYSLLKELIGAGYMVRHQTRNPDGTIGPIEYLVSEVGQPGLKASDKPDTDKPHTDLPYRVETTQASIEEKQVLNRARIDTGKASEKASGVMFNKATGSFEGITPEHLALWKKAYPGLAVETEITRASCWLLANPTRAKSNYVRFLSNWMGRAESFKPPPADQTQPLNRLERARQFNQSLSAALRQATEQGAKNADAIDV